MSEVSEMIPKYITKEIEVNEWWELANNKDKTAKASVKQG